MSTVDDDADARATAALTGMADLLTPMVLRVAATLRIADHIAEGRRTAAELAAATSTDTGVLERVLRHLVTVGVLQFDDASAYSLTPLGSALRADHPSRRRAMWDINGALGRAELAFVELLHTVRTGEAAFPARYGRGFWDDLAAHSDRSTEYNATMGHDVAAWAPSIVAAYDWGSLDWIVDVGGGNGTLVEALLRNFRSLRGTVLDQPATAAEAHARLAEAGLGDRGNAVAGDFFDPLPRGASGYVLTAVIHDWDDGRAQQILQRCRDAAGANGRVFVIEKIGADGVTPSTWMDLVLLAHMQGKERTRPELTALAAAAGLRPVAMHDADAIVILELAGA